MKGDYYRYITEVLDEDHKDEKTGLSNIIFNKTILVTYIRHRNLILYKINYEYVLNLHIILVLVLQGDLLFNSMGVVIGCGS